MTKLTEELLNDPIIKARIAQLNDQRVRWSISYEVLFANWDWRVVHIENHESRNRDDQMATFRIMVPLGCVVWAQDDNGYRVLLAQRSRVTVRFLDKHPVSV